MRIRGAHSSSGCGRVSDVWLVVRVIFLVGESILYGGCFCVGKNSLIPFEFVKQLNDSVRISG